jgi:hypothetical protein
MDRVAFAINVAKREREFLNPEIKYISTNCEKRDIDNGFFMVLLLLTILRLPDGPRNMSVLLAFGSDLFAWSHSYSMCMDVFGLQ